MSVYTANTITEIIDTTPHPKINPKMSQAISLKSLFINFLSK